ncbi:MAG: HAD family phosphatase [Planctomycetota bacterium]
MAHPFGVIFDMDGVLVDSAKPHFESWRRLGAELGVVVRQTQFAATFGRQNRDIIPLLFDVRDPVRIAALADRKESIYRDLVRVDAPIVEGAVGLLRSLHQSGFRLALGSSGPRENIEMILAAMGVPALFPVIVSADDVTRGKPDPQVFTLCCQGLALPPSRCIVIEDAPVGIQAARAAGSRSVAVLLYHPREAFPHAELIVDRLADLTVARLTALLDGRDD